MIQIKNGEQIGVKNIKLIARKPAETEDEEVQQANEQKEARQGPDNNEGKSQLRYLKLEKKRTWLPIFSFGA